MRLRDQYVGTYCHTRAIKNKRYGCEQGTKAGASYDSSRMRVTCGTRVGLWDPCGIVGMWVSVNVSNGVRIWVNDCVSGGVRLSLSVGVTVYI